MLCRFEHVGLSPRIWVTGASPTVKGDRRVSLGLGSRVMKPETFDGATRANAAQSSCSGPDFAGSGTPRKLRVNLYIASVNPVAFMTLSSDRPKVACSDYRPCGTTVWVNVGKIRDARGPGGDNFVTRPLGNLAYKVHLTACCRRRSPQARCNTSCVSCPSIIEKSNWVDPAA